MRKLCILTIIAIISGFAVSCRQPEVPNNAFRVRTRGKIHLFGIPLPFSIPNPNIAINLKTVTPAGTAGTTGNISEFNPGGAFVSTNGSGYFDANNAVIPAVWTAKPAPNQSLCNASGTAQTSFNAVAKGIYSFNCRWNVTVTFLIEPGLLDLSGSVNPTNSLTGIFRKDLNRVPRLLNASNLKVRYYKNVGGEDYELEQYGFVTNVSADGSEATFTLPERLENSGGVNYKLLIVEEDAQYDTFVGVGDLFVIFPLRDPPPPCGPGGEICW